jgi:hypothetical protein
MAVIRFRRQRLIKYLILIPIIWLAYVILFGVGHEAEVKRSAADQEIIDRLLAKANQNHINHQKELNEKANDKIPAIDNDHPEEERAKAEKQEKDVKGRVQINAPVAVNPDAPGKSSLDTSHNSVSFR